MITTQQTSRLLSSRKLWGASIGGVFILIIILIGELATQPLAIGAITTLFSLAIGGQAVGDFMKARTIKDNGDK